MLNKDEVRYFFTNNLVCKLVNEGRFDDLYQLFDLYKDIRPGSIHIWDVTQVLLAIDCFYDDFSNAIPDNCFRTCDIEEIYLKDNIRIIGKSAFCDCKKLNTFRLSRFISAIDDYAFNGCDVLKEIVFEGSIEEWNNIRFGNSWCNTSILKRVCCNDGDIYL